MPAVGSVVPVGRHLSWHQSTKSIALAAAAACAACAPWWYFVCVITPLQVVFRYISNIYHQYTLLAWLGCLYYIFVASKMPELCDFLVLGGVGDLALERSILKHFNMYDG